MTRFAPPPAACSKIFKTMATDGIKIIDGDRARDAYWGIMDLYDSGADFDVIEKEFPLNLPDFIDEFDNEIYVTSCAWRITKHRQRCSK